MKSISELIGLASQMDMEATAATSPDIRRLIMFGLIVFVFGFLGVWIWASFAPLASAAIAPGSVSSESQRKTVQHLHGGIIEEIMVREGDHVQAGQVLIRLDDLEIRSRFDLLKAQHYATLALEARLKAERDGLDDISFPPPLQMRKDKPEIREIIDGQRQIFKSRRASRSSQVDVLKQQISQLQEQISAFKVQLEATDDQAKLIGEEISGVQQLLDKGLERRPRLLALQRQEAQLRGREGDLRGQIATAKEDIGEAELRIIGIQNNFEREVNEQLRETQDKLVDLEEKLSHFVVQLARLEVVAPQTGTVINLRYVTPGGVISPNGAILDLVPEGDSLIIEARLDPADIDFVRAGMDARVRMTGMSARNTPLLEGEVTHVSADSLQDERTGIYYFLTRVNIHPDQLEKYPDVELSPGMPAEVIIQAGDRTVMQYLLSPIRDSFTRAFREQ